MIWDVYLVKALACGVEWETFWHITPKELSYFLKAYREKQKEKDRDMWIQGQYVRMAIISTVGNSPMYRKKGSKPHEYPKEPMLSNVETDVDNSPNKQNKNKDNITSQTEQLFMKLDIMARNQRLSKKDKRMVEDGNEINTDSSQEQ